MLTQAFRRIAGREDQPASRVSVQPVQIAIEPIETTISRLEARIRELRTVVTSNKARKGEIALAWFRGDDQAAATLAAFDREAAQAAVDLQNLQLALDAAREEARVAESGRRAAAHVRHYAERLPTLRTMERERRQNLSRNVDRWLAEHDTAQVEIHLNAFDRSENQVIPPAPDNFIEDTKSAEAWAAENAKFTEWRQQVENKLAARFGRQPKRVHNVVLPQAETA